MALIQRVFQYHRWPFILVLLLSITSGLLSVGVIAFVNERMIHGANVSGLALWQFGMLLVLMLALASGAQICLTTLGHRFVYGLRREMVKRLLDTDVQTLERLGHGKLFASLSSDLRNVTLAFVHLPELVYGGVLTLASFAYMAWLSPAMFAVTALWMLSTLAIGVVFLRRMRRQLALLREAEDEMYRQYQAMLDGSKELALNRARAQHIYDGSFDASARAYRHHISWADRYHGLASNWANIMVLGTIGLAFYLAKGLGWAEPAVAATYALTILFMRTPLVGAVAAVPAQLAGKLALGKVESLGLAKAQAGFEVPSRTDPDWPQWQRLELCDVVFNYPAAKDDPGFDVGPLNLTLQRGETVFVIGGNGSGKSSLARLLSGIYRPQSGGIFLDGHAVTDADVARYRGLISAVFTDFHLFAQLLGPGGEPAASAPLQHWLQALQMHEKARIADGHLQSTQVSQGQRKRLALLLALLEERDIVLLDEWAADQDPLYRRVFYRELLPELKKMGKTTIVISHDDRYFDVADRLLQMQGGQLSELRGAQRERAGRDALQAIDGSQAQESPESPQSFV